MKKKVQLICSECLRSNYNTNKSSLERIEVKKYCKHCKEHTIHKESK